MAVVPNNSSAPFGAVSLYRFVSGLEHGLQTVTAWNKARRAERVLLGMSDRQLLDIGIERCDIEGVSRQMATRR